MHVARTPSKYVDKAGNVRRYESVLVRRTYPRRRKVRHETLANLSKLPAEVIAAIEATLKGQTLVPAGSEFAITRSLPHGHVAAVAAMAHQLGLPALLGPACRAARSALALIVSRVVRPDVETVHPGLVARHHPRGRSGRGRRVHRRGLRRDGLAGRPAGRDREASSRPNTLPAEVNPARMALFDLTSAWVTGRCCELAARGYSRDGKKGCEQIEYGVLTDPAGRPVAVRVFPGNTADPAAFTEIVTVIRDTLGIARLVLVGDRGMITSARIDALRELNEDPDTATISAGSPRCAHPRSPNSPAPTARCR